MTKCKRASRYFLPIFGALFVLLTGGTAARAGVSPIWVSVGVSGGVTQPDGEFEKYQWDPNAQPHWGVESYVGTGRVAIGLRGSTTQNEQSLSVPGAPALSANVRLMSGELLVRLTAIEAVGFELYGFGGGGRFRLDYDPGQLDVPVPGTNQIVSVDLDSIGGWIGTAGVGLRRGFMGGWGVGVELDHHRFSLETAHRSGGEIVRTEEDFGQWTARAGVSWSFGRF